MSSKTIFACARGELPVPQEKGVTLEKEVEQDDESPAIREEEAPDLSKAVWADYAQQLAEEAPCSRSSGSYANTGAKKM